MNKLELQKTANEIRKGIVIFKIETIVTAQKRTNL